VEIKEEQQLAEKIVDNRATLGEMHEIKDDKSSHSFSVELGIK
jgi:hypothetical protein